MGNCQTIDTATLVIQHPSGKSERLYWPVSAAEVMKTNPGHYVALLISTTFCPDPASAGNRASADQGGRVVAAVPGNNVRVTRIKLLRPTDTLMLGQVYRLITAQEVMKVLSAKKNGKMKKGQLREESLEKMMGSNMKVHNYNHNNNLQVGKPECQRRSHNTEASNSGGTPRPRTWQPSLHSISESAT
ncbi:hypothetical protein SAY86_016362 [Trapa natans]|uniref:DUF4228 domain-containing protein n=1 Tax=Trapa natans TaxID=22666 RepID=A0AAN7LJG7_TRANT|nr:hypothetical protein SAY86_016362 [Trapa natans]